MKEKYLLDSMYLNFYVDFYLFKNNTAQRANEFN